MNGLSLGLLAWLAAAPAFGQQAHELTLGETLATVEKADPGLKAAQEFHAQATNAVSIAESYYFPTVNFGAVQSYGFPGSSASALGLQGLMASAYRSGPAGGLFSQITLFDLQREFGLKASRFRLRSAAERERAQRLQVDLQALGLFLEAALERSQRETWHRIGERTQKVADIVQRFARGGQHSVVSLWLVQDQKKVSDIAETTFEQQYAASLQRLALLAGLDNGAIACPLISSLSEKDLDAIAPGGSNPLVESARAEAQAAHAQASVYFAQNLPTISAVASVGDMSLSKVVSISAKGTASYSAKQDYSGGFGVIIPVFAGNRIDSQVKRAEHAAGEKDQELRAAELELADANIRYDQAVSLARVKLQMLVEEDQTALRALDQATSRYLSFIGTLVDVREAIRNLARVETDINTTKAELLLGLGSKALVNGGSVAR